MGQERHQAECLVEEAAVEFSSMHKTYPGRAISAPMEDREALPSMPAVVVVAAGLRSTTGPWPCRQQILLLLAVQAQTPRLQSMEAPEPYTCRTPRCPGRILLSTTVVLLAVV